jgi:hypothetical protein
VAEAQAQKKNNTVMTPTFRVNFPNLLKASLNKLNNKMEFSCMAIFKKGEDLKKLQALAQAAIVDKWGADQARWPKDPATGKVDIRSPFRKHEEKRIESESGALIFPQGMEEGGIFITMKSLRAPGVVDGARQAILDEKLLYSGCYGRAIVSAYAYGGTGTGFKAGVSFWLVHFQKVSEGDPLGSRVAAEDAFEAIEGAGVAAGDAASLFG